MKQILIVIFIIFILSGCSTYKTFKTPETDIGNVCGDNVDLQDPLSEEVPSRQEMFPDIFLQQLIEKGIASNTDLQIARLNIEQAAASLRASKLAYLPSFALVPEGNITKAEGEKTVYSYNLPLTTQWEIDLSGRLRNSKEQARAVMMQSNEYARMVQTQLVASIANNYYTLIMLDEQLRITRESIHNQKENLEVITAMKEAGMQTEAAVNQATADYYNIMSSEKDLEKQIQIVENSIALLINETPHAIPRSSIDINDSVTTNVAGAVSLVTLANRPDVKEAEYALRRNFYGINVARSAFYPSIVLSGSAGWTNNTGVISNPGSMLLSAIGSLTQPLFSRGTNQANLKIAKSQYEQSLLTFEKTLLVAGSEVNNALVQCQKSAEKLELRQKQVNANESALTNSTELMKYSSTTYLEVLIAQSTLLQSRLMYVSDWYEGVQGQIDLYKALGGGI